MISQMSETELRAALLEANEKVEEWKNKAYVFEHKLNEKNSTIIGMLNALGLPRNTDAPVNASVHLRDAYDELIATNNQLKQALTAARAFEKNARLQGLTLTTLCDLVLGEDATDRSDELLIRTISAKHRELIALRSEVETLRAMIVKCFVDARRQNEITGWARAWKSAAKKYRAKWLESVALVARLSRLLSSETQISEGRRDTLFFKAVQLRELEIRVMRLESALQVTKEE